MAIVVRVILSTSSCLESRMGAAARGVIGMVQSGSGLSFALETGQGLGISIYFVGQEFEGYKAARFMSCVL
jgi:hypothetical protein